MKKNIYILLIFILLSRIVNAQEYFKVADIDNSDYPFIKVSIKANEIINLTDLYIYEKNNRIKYTDTVIIKDYKKERSILFVIKENSTSEIKEALINLIHSFSKSDKINLAIILDSDTSKNIIHYLSPEFTNNHSFFIKALQYEKFESINYNLSKDLKRLSSLIEKNMFAKQGVFSNKGIIFIADNLKIKTEPYSNLLKKGKIPVYILLTKKPQEDNQHELSSLCSTTEGMYTVIEKDAIKNQLLLYLDDIYWQKKEIKPELYTLIFETTQSKDKNLFKIRYKDSLKEYVFNKPPKYGGYNKREIFLIILSVFLLIFLILVSFRNRKKRNLISLFRDIKDGIGTKKMYSKPIEINVKSKGFNKTYFLEKHIISIGRSSSNDIIIPDRTVSGSHSVITRENESFFIQDLNSTNGTIVNGKKVKKQKLNSKDKIKLGSAMLIVVI